MREQALAAIEEAVTSSCSRLMDAQDHADDAESHSCGSRETGICAGELDGQKQEALVYEFTHLGLRTFSRSLLARPWRRRALKRSTATGLSESMI